MFSIFLKTYYILRKKPVPYYAHYPLWLLLWKPIRKIINVVVIPCIPYNCLRIVLYRLIGFKIGRNVFIGMRCYLDDIEPAKTTIGDNVTISYGCYFTSHGKNQGHTDIRISDNVYLGMRVSVVSGKTGVSIGRNCVIGACALVLQSIPDNCVAVGVPAHVIKQNGDLANKSPTQCPRD